MNLFISFQNNILDETLARIIKYKDRTLVFIATKRSSVSYVLHVSVKYCISPVKGKWIQYIL